MIPNFTTGGDPGGLARYLLGYKNQKADKQASVLGSAGVRTDTLAHLVTDFELGAMLHPELGRSVLHISLSFNPDDAARMTDQKMRQIAEEYMKEMGMAGTQYLLVRHRDRPHQHLHIMATRVADDGHTIPDSNNFFDSKTAVAKLVARHELSPAKERRPHLQNPDRLRGRDLDRYKLRAALDEELAPNKATQRPALLAALAERGIAHREFRDQNGTVTGISFKMGGYACKGSALGPEYSSVGIDRRLAANQQKALEAAGQRTEPTTLSGPVATGAEQKLSPAVILAAPPAVEPARKEAAVGFSALLKSAVKEVLNNRPEKPIREELPPSIAPVPAAARPEVPQLPGVASVQREPAQALPLVPAGDAEAPVESSAQARASVPVAAPIFPKEMGSVKEAKQSPITVPATNEASPAPAEVQGLLPAAAAESTSPATPVALVPPTALPQEQVSTAVNVNQASEPARVEEPVPSSAATALPTEAVVPPAASFTSASDFEEKLARWEAQQLADVEDERLAVLYYAWLQLEKQVQQQVTVATHEALATGAAFATLLDRQGLELLPATSNEPICVRHRASGESFSAEEIPLPQLLLTPASQASAQYGLVQMAGTDRRAAPERLAEVRAHLLEAGLVVGVVEPAEARKPAQLTWAFNPLQTDLDLNAVMTKLDAVQASPNARVLEAPHAWQAGAGKMGGPAGPQLSWSIRAGQFNQARLGLDSTDERAAGRVNRVRQALSEQGVKLGPVETDAQGRLSFEFRYHTLAPTIDPIDTVLLQASSAGFDLRESKQQQQARFQGILYVTQRDAGKEYFR
ncbi:MAG TPA: relaxase/mobilization nuclease domain-containing protein [Hymenobacter sp.]|jgi:hypothetical protein